MVRSCFLSLSCPLFCKADARFNAGEFTDWQIKRAAKLTQRLVDFKVRLDRFVSLLFSSREKVD